MKRILIGRAGEDLHAFDLDDVKRGAVRESGLFPELYESPWPEVTSGILVTGVERKLSEHTATLAAGEFDFPLFAPPQVLTRALEDSKEEEKTVSGIAVGKVLKGFVNPVRKELTKLSPIGAKAFSDGITQRARVLNLQNLVAIGDDRQLYAPQEMCELICGHLRDHWNDQVREVFEQENFPGARVKEMDGANYGGVNSVYLFNQAARELGIDAEYYSTTTLSVMPLLPGVLPLPEEGLVIKAEGMPYKLREVGKSDIKKYNKGRILTRDHFELVSDPNASEEQTVHQLRTVRPQDPYLTQETSQGRAMTAFASVLGLSKKGANDHISRPEQKKVRGPKTVVSSARFFAFPPSAEEINASISLPEHMRLGQNSQRIQSLADLERAMHSGQAFLVQDPDKFSLPKRRRQEPSDERLQFLRRLETDLIYADLITMSTQAGAPGHIGRPHLVEKSYFKKRGLWHPDFCNLALAGDEEQEAFRLYETAQELQDGLKSWDETTYQHDVPTPRNDFLDERALKRALSINEFGFVVSGYGSASSFIDKGYKDPEELFYRLSKLNNLTTFDGGGVRSSMLGMKDGVLRAIEEGYHALNVGVRSETDVSPLEGNIKDWIRSKGFTVRQGFDPRHLHFADRQMHVLRLDRLLQRQAAIAAMSDISVYFPGGKGTMIEIALTKLHNALVDTYGYGLFEGYSNNDRKIPLVFVDHKFEHLGQKRGVFDKVLELDKEHHDMLDIHVFDGARSVEKAYAFIREYGESLGYDLSEQTPKAPSLQLVSSPGL